jgi:hypothetical protein
MADETMSVQRQEDLEKAVRMRILRLHAIIVGIVTGLVAGLVIFLATIILVIKGGETVGPHLWLLSQYFAGYQVSFAGSLIGFAYGFVCGFATGFFISAVYNWLAGIRDRRERTSPCQPTAK